MRSSPSLLLVAWLSAAAPRALAAQSAVVVRQGDRVRLRVDTTSAVPTWRVGTLAAVRRDTLVLRPCFRCAGEAYARANVRALDVSAGRPNHAGAGIALGALAGVAAVAVSIQRCERHHGGEGPPCGLGVTVMPIAAIVGAIGGGVVGRFIPAGRERWRSARVAAPVR